MSRLPLRLCGFVIAALCALASTPAQASDFTGMGTMFASLFGITLLWTTGTVFAASRLSSQPNVRLWLPIIGLVVGLGLTVWWIMDPIAEGYALLICWIAPILALIVASKTRTQGSPGIT